jgi:hypothetical protein
MYSSRFYSGGYLLISRQVSVAASRAFSSILEGFASQNAHKTDKTGFGQNVTKTWREWRCSALAGVFPILWFL